MLISAGISGMAWNAIMLFLPLVMLINRQKNIYIIKKVN